MKQFTPKDITEDMKNAAEALILAKAYTKTIRPVVRGYQNEILSFYQWHVALEWVEKGEKDFIITNPKHTYLMRDEDFQLYLKECNIAREKAGLKVDNPDHCPLLIAESLETDAENVLIEAMRPVTGVGVEHLYRLEHRKKLIDLSLKLLVPFIGNTESILRGN